MAGIEPETPVVPLQLSNLAWRHHLHALWRRADQVEAALLGVEEFPPLRISSNALAAGSGRFYGVVQGDRLLGAVEVETKEDSACAISALVVDPDCFRRGIGKQLVRFVLDSATGPVQVSTAAGNAPAISLYQSLGFRQTAAVESPEGIQLLSLVHDRRDSPRQSAQAKRSKRVREAHANSPPSSRRDAPR